MFGRKARRIAELEAEVADVRDNLTNVTVQFPTPARIAFEATAVRKGVWHTASVRFMVDDAGSRLHGMYLGEEEAPGPYSDGSMPSAEAKVAAALACIHPPAHYLAKPHKAARDIEYVREALEGSRP